MFLLALFSEFFLKPGHSTKYIWPDVCERPRNDYQYNVKCNAEPQSSLGMHPKCSAMLHSGAKMTREEYLPEALDKIKQSGPLCITVAIGWSHTIAVLDRVKCQLTTVPLQPKKEHHIGFIVLSLIKTKPEVTQVIIVHKRSDTTKCSVPKQESRRIKGSFHQCKISHA